MSQSFIINAAPMVIERGTQDLSTRQLPREQEAIPQHLPKFYIYAEKGPLTPQLVVGATRQNTYGVNTFDIRKKYANHATVFANLINAEGNSQMIERIIPDDAGPESNLLLSIEILKTKVDPYQRDDDGNVVYVFNGATNKLEPVTSGTLVDGYKARWITSSNTTKVTAVKFGNASPVIGTWAEDPAVGTNVSTIYPVLELKASSQGAFGNNAGVTIWAPNSKTQGGFNSRLMKAEKTYPFTFRPSSARNIKSIVR